MSESLFKAQYLEQGFVVGVPWSEHTGSALTHVRSLLNRGSLHASQTATVNLVRQDFWLYSRQARLAVQTGLLCPCQKQLVLSMLCIAAHHKSPTVLTPGICIQVVERQTIVVCYS